MNFYVVDHDQEEQKILKKPLNGILTTPFWVLPITLTKRTKMQFGSVSILSLLIMNWHLIMATN